MGARHPSALLLAGSEITNQKLAIGDRQRASMHQRAPSGTNNHSEQCYALMLLYVEQNILRGHDTLSDWSRIPSNSITSRLEGIISRIVHLGPLGQFRKKHI